tara:strand:+ start:97969 stop:99180 length:1212 start_codon:yes stop_codon:yes gene_type:complete
MPLLRLFGALGSLEFEIPLESLVVFTSTGSDAAERLAFGLIAAEAQRQMAPLLAPTWLPSIGRLATREEGSIEGLRPTFCVRRCDAEWPQGTRVGHVLGILPLLQQALGCDGASSCGACSGAGQRAEVALEALISDPSLSLAEGAIAPWAEKNSKYYLGVLQTLAQRIGLDVALPWSSLSPAMRSVVLYGSPESNYKGVVHDVERRVAKIGEGRGGETMAALSKYLVWQDCAVCSGTGKDGAALLCTRAGVDLVLLYQTSISKLGPHIESLASTLDAGAAFRLHERVARQQHMADALGLASETLGCRVEDVSPVSARQLRLGEVLGSGLQKAIYVLQTPLLELSGILRASTLGLIEQRVAAGDSVFMLEEHPDAAACADACFRLDVAADTGLVSVVQTARSQT